MGVSTIVAQYDKAAAELTKEYDALDPDVVHGAWAPDLVHKNPGLACDIGAFEDSSQTPNAITRSSFDAGAMPPGVGGPLLAAGTAILGGLAAGWAFVRKRARAG